LRKAFVETANATSALHDDVATLAIDGCNDLLAIGLPGLRAVGLADVYRQRSREP
jgi:hypothetical protein